VGSFEVRGVLAGDQGRVAVEAEGDVTAEAESAGPVLAGRKGDDSARPSGGVDRGLDGPGVEGAAVAPRAMSANTVLGLDLAGP
jgi:hypothetical protein